MMAGRFASLFGRLALAVGFLSAVADRFGLWGPPGATNVVWGNFASFLAYAASINPYLPSALIPAVGWTATVAEVMLAAMLLAGIYTRWCALLSGCLLMAFAFGMATGTGLKSVFDASVLAASAAAFLLASQSSGERPCESPLRKP